MNRLSAPAAPPQRSGAASLRSARPVVKTTPRHDAPHCLLAPLHYEPNYAYPLIVWLHGQSGNEQELKQVMPMISLRNYVSVGVRGVNEERRGFNWMQTPDAILAAEARIADAVAQARNRFHVHSEKIFIAGYATGGTMALRIALRNPQSYAAVASLGGPFPERHSPLARLDQLRENRFLISHCRDSLIYPVDQVCQELSLFHAAGMSVMLRQYPCGDELTTQMLRDLDVWLMEQVTGVSSTGDSQLAPLPSDWN
jgi:phospholipase/carboxylesterase